MANRVFNVALGRVVHYATLPETNDALTVVLLKDAVADATLNDFDDLDALLDGGNTEADFTNYARAEIDSGVTITVDDPENRVDVDIDDVVWEDAGNGTNNTLAKLLICYDPDTTGGTDEDVIPLTHHDFSLTTDGSTLIAEIAAAGFFRAQQVAA